MAEQVTVRGDDLEALATRLEAMGDQFDDTEAAAIQALFALAGDALADRDESEVQGFLLPAVQTPNRGVGLSLPAVQMGNPGTQGVLIGLLRTGASSMQDFHFKGGAAMGDGSV